MSHGTHTSRDFESELRELRAHSLAMGARCERALQLALKAFWDGSSILAAEVEEIDRHIDRDEMDIDALVLRILALRQPVAYDLRFLAGALRLVTDLERVGDEAVNIAERAKEEHGTAKDKVRGELKTMGEQSQEMLRDALDAFVQGEATRAEQVLVRDDAVDELYGRIIRAMTDFMSQHPGQVAEALRVIHVAKYLERVADHATNIAEEVIFMVRGEDVRHFRTHPPAKVERRVTRLRLQKTQKCFHSLREEPRGSAILGDEERPGGAPDARRTVMSSTMNASARRIAHLSDVHMLDARPSRARSGYSMGHRFLSLGRPLDAAERRKKLARALSAAQRVGADHVVISGDLTEIGSPGEFECLGESLHDSGIAPGRVTLVPGNHDLYTSADAWTRALEGPLAAYRPTSAAEPGRIIECAGVRFMPLDVARFQPLTRSAGWIEDGALDAVHRRAADPGLADRPLLVVQHHPPFVRATQAWQWVDGLIGAARLMSILEAFRHLFVLHGHLHSAVNRVLGCGVARVLGATAIVDDKDAPRVRLYDVRDGRLEAAGLVTG